MQSKAALVGTNIQGFAFGTGSSRGIIFPLVKKAPGFLAAQGFVVELHAIHGEYSLAAAAMQQSGSKRWKLFQFTYALVHAFHNVFRARQLPQLLDHRSAPVRV